MWLQHTHLFNFKCLPIIHSRHTPRQPHFSAQTICVWVHFCLSSGWFGGEHHTLARHSDSRQSLSGQAEIPQQDTWQFLLSKCFCIGFFFPNIPYYIQGLDSILWLEDKISPRFQGARGLQHGPGELAAPKQWWDLPSMQNSGLWDSLVG